MMKRLFSGTVRFVLALSAFVVYPFASEASEQTITKVFVSVQPPDYEQFYPQITEEQYKSLRADTAFKLVLTRADGSMQTPSVVDRKFANGTAIFTLQSGDKITIHE